MNFDSPDTLDTYADRVAANGGDLEAGILRAFAKAWHADRARIDALQDENTQIQRQLDAARSELQSMKAQNVEAARTVFAAAKTIYDRAAA